MSKLWIAAMVCTWVCIIPGALILGIGYRHYGSAGCALIAGGVAVVASFLWSMRSSDQQP